MLVVQDKKGNRMDLNIENSELLRHYQNEMMQELKDILTYWKQWTVDEIHGGFYGSVNNLNNPDHKAPKGVVLNARICWTFSAAYQQIADREYFNLAKRSFDYIVKYFIDKEQGGVFWSVDYKGNLLEEKKQIYGLAFCIYGLSEYYHISGDDTALRYAKELHELIQEHSLDADKGGYIEAFNREWKELSDLRLSEKDDNERKTMNTHLHIIEGYANLYRVWPDEKLKKDIRYLLGVFQNRFYNTANSHMNLFFDDNWSIRSELQSYGHDIEAAWLLLRCAEIINDQEFISVYRELAIKITNASLEGLDSDGGLWYEYDPGNRQIVKEKHSWPQAEAMIGFFNAWQISGHDNYLLYSWNSWQFVKKYLKDHKRGEWFWGINSDYSIMEKDKAGFWKCPYHNSRACIQIINRIDAVIKKETVVKVKN